MGGSAVGQIGMSLRILRCGIQALAHRERLFEAPVSGRREHEGGGYHLGLGLYVVRRIAEAHGGQVTASNLPDGRGARFSVWLPASG